MSGSRQPYSVGKVWLHLDAVQRHVPWKDRFRCTNYDPIVQYCMSHWTPEIPYDVWQDLLTQYWSNKYYLAQEGWQARVI
jgi:hypothetical protein